MVKVSTAAGQHHEPRPRIRNAFAKTLQGLKMVMQVNVMMDYQTTTTTTGIRSKGSFSSNRHGLDRDERSSWLGLRWREGVVDVQ
jgi:hypothetical protein